VTELGGVKRLLQFRGDGYASAFPVHSFLTHGEPRIGSDFDSIAALNFEAYREFATPMILIRRACLVTAVLVLMATLMAQLVHPAARDQTRFQRISTQFIAALGDPGATSGSGAQSWGLWPLDPGPRGVELKHYQRLKDAGGVAPARWKFDGTDWWLEEHGLIMEQPTFPLPPGKYMVTGARDVLRRDAPGLPLCALYTGTGWWFVLAGKRAEDCVSRCARGSDASGRGLHEAGLCGSHRDRYRRGKLNTEH